MISKNEISKDTPLAMLTIGQLSSYLGLRMRTCTSGDAYSCTTLNGEIVSGSCKAKTYKYCTSEAGTTCADTPPNTSYNYFCIFYGDTKKSCETETYSSCQIITCGSDVLMKNMYCVKRGAVEECWSDYEKECAKPGNSYVCMVYNHRRAYICDPIV